MNPRITVTIEDVQQIKSALTDFAYFCREVLGYSDMIAPHEELCRFLVQQSESTKLILMPRYSYKSSIATIAYTLYRLARDPNERILIYSDASSKAQGFLTEIQNHILGKKQRSRFRKLFGHWEVDPKKGKWNQSNIDIRPKTSASAEPSVDTAGMETSKVGMHYDRIIFDDLVTEMNTTTQEQLLKTKECYQKSFSLLKPGGEVLLIGTRWHFGDLYGELVATAKDIWPFIKDAETDPVYGDFPFAAIRLTPEFLRKQRERQGSKVYSCLYRNNPVDDETATFKAADFRFYTQRPDHLYITATLDPATGEGDDDSALVVCGTDDKLRLYVLEIIAGKLLPDAQVDALFDLHRRWGIQRFGIETTAFQRILKRDIERRMAIERANDPNFRGFLVEEFSGIAQRSKQQRIEALQPYHERGDLRLPGDRLETLTGCYRTLMLQMLQFPRSLHDDVLDALAYHVPIHRAGGVSRVPSIAPEFSPAWAERQYWLGEEARQETLPRNLRQSIPEMVFQ